MAQIYAQLRDGGILGYLLVHLLEWDCTRMNYKIIQLSTLPIYNNALRLKCYCGVTLDFKL
jgi:hypothetical protein